MGTFVVNVSGSLLLGFLMRYTLATPSVSPEIRAMLTTGLCGGYTTFSTYAVVASATLVAIGLGGWFIARPQPADATEALIMASIGSARSGVLPDLDLAL